MEIGQIINHYLIQANGTAKKLSRITGISPPTISRYRNAKGNLSLTTEQLQILAHGLSCLAGGTPEPETIQQELLSASNLLTQKYKINAGHLDLLIRHTETNVADLSKSMNFDPSYISRIRCGQRSPVDAEDFADKAASFFEEKFVDSDTQRTIGLQSINRESLREDLVRWLLSEHNDPAYPDNGTDPFNLNNYINWVHFSQIPVTTLPCQIPVKNTYYGVSGRQKANLVFLRNVLQSRTQQDLILYSELPVKTIMCNLQFSKTWAQTLSSVLKSGHRTHVVFNLYRPRQELVRMIQFWIPLAMSGMIDFYYISEPPSGAHRHVCDTSGNITLTGFCLENESDRAIIILSKSRDAVRYFRDQNEKLIQNSKRLFTVYDPTNEEELHRFLNQEQDYFEIDAARQAFSRIRILVRPGHWACVSRSDPSGLHLLTRQSNMVDAFENFTAPDCRPEDIPDP